MQPAIVRRRAPHAQLVNVPLPTGAVAGFAVDVQELEEARSELHRHIESQRELADRMTAGVAQFDAERTLSTFNRPFAVMAQLDPEWLAKLPNSIACSSGCARTIACPKSATSRPGRRSDAPGSAVPRRSVEEEWMLPDGDHLRVVAQPLPDGGLRLFAEDRTEQLRLASARDTLLRVRAATFDNLFEAISVFASDGRLYLWNRRFMEHLGARRGLADGATRASTSWCRRWRESSLTLRLPRKSARWSGKPRTSDSPRAGRIALTDGRHFQFAAVPLPDGNALFTMVDITDRPASRKLCASALKHWKRPTGSRRTSLRT